LAQANLNGGGDADAGRATTPLPVLGEDAANFQIESTLQQQKHIEEMRNTLLRQLETGPNSTPQPASSVKTQQHSPTLNKTLTPEQQALKTQIARLEAEIARDLEHYAKRPRRAQLTATSAKQALFALYYDGVRRKIEARGTAQFPQEDGQPLYGELVLTLHVNRLGGLGYKKDGWTVEGVKLEKSSGKPALDRQAMAIARSAAPFGVFTQELRERYDVLEIISTFRFTRAGLQTDVAQGSSEDRRQ
jgi:protein TonB